MKTATKRAVLTAAALLMSAATLTGCSNGANSGGSGSSTGASSSTSASAASHGGDKAKIGLLLPDNVTYRYAAQDYPLFKAEVAAKCPGCTVTYENAAASASTQQQQATSLLTAGVNVLVLDPQDGKAAAQIVTLAKQKNVPVISYDRLIDSPDLAAYTSYDNEKVGELQGQSLVARMKALGDKAGAGYIQVNGSPTDPNAASFKAGATKVLSASGFKLLGEYDTPDWLPAKAQAWATSEISKVGASNIKGVYAANDDTGNGVITALQTAGVKTLPPVTGQDATLAGIQRILAGTQYMTIFKNPKPEAQIAADWAVELAHGESLNTQTTAKTTSGYSAPATLFTPVAVTKSNIESTVIAAGTFKASQICTSTYAAACTANGVK